MTKKYTHVTDEKRRRLIHLIHEQGMSIIKASKMAQVNYPVAKVIYNVFKIEGRTDKKITRDRKGMDQ